MPTIEFYRNAYIGFQYCPFSCPDSKKITSNRQTIVIKTVINTLDVLMGEKH